MSQKFCETVYRHAYSYAGFDEATATNDGSNKARVKFRYFSFWGKEIASEAILNPGESFSRRIPGYLEAYASALEEGNCVYLTFH